MSGSAITENRGYNTETSRSDDLSFTRHLRPHNPTTTKSVNYFRAHMKDAKFSQHNNALCRHLLMLIHEKRITIKLDTQGIFTICGHNDVIKAPARWAGPGGVRIQ